MSGHSARYPHLVRRFWREAWAEEHDTVLTELLSPDITFRGSLGLVTRGREGVSGYVRMVRAALPDFSARIDELIHDGDRLAARITFSGTHRGTLFEVPATGQRLSYPAVAIHRFRDGRMVDVWVVGDTLGLARQLGEVCIRPGVAP